MRRLYTFTVKVSFEIAEGESRLPEEAAMEGLIETCLDVLGDDLNDYHDEKSSLDVLGSHKVESVELVSSVEPIEKPGPTR